MMHRIALRSITRPVPTFRSRTVISRRCLTLAADVQFGQPIHETHPHLIEAGHLTPGISALEYHQRRAALVAQLPENSVVVLAAADVKYRSGAVFYNYHQEPNFYYLTGFKEPDSVAVIAKGTASSEYTFHLLVRPKDPAAEQWDGARSGVQAAQDVFNADESASITNLPTLLPPLLSSAKNIYTDLNTPATTRPRSAFARFLTSTTLTPDTSRGKDLLSLLASHTSKPLRPLMNALRVRKSPAEIACMRRAGEISGAVLTECMKNTPSNEKQLWADLAYGYKSNGLDGEAYVPVVGGGKNALSVHYVRNDGLLRDGEVVLVDAGGEYGGYVTDITRTWPVSGQWSEAQSDLYGMVLEVQKECVGLCRESAGLALEGIHRRCEEGLEKGLRRLGFDVSGNKVGRLFPHNVGHHVGLDVHDAPGYPQSDRLKENYCITIEPGIYVPDEEGWPKHFRGLGIRIEDSVRVGKDRPDVLTATAVKEIDEIEALRM